jgi:hypothetical protein
MNSGGPQIEAVQIAEQGHQQQTQRNAYDSLFEFVIAAALAVRANDFGHCTDRVLPERKCFE